MWPFNKKKPRPAIPENSDRMLPYHQQVLDGGYFNFYENMDGRFIGSLKWEEMILDLGLPSKNVVDHAKEYRKEAEFFEVFWDYASDIHSLIKEPVLTLGRTIRQVVMSGEYEFFKTMMRGLERDEEGYGISEWETVFKSHNLILCTRILNINEFDAFKDISPGQPFIINSVDYSKFLTNAEKMFIGYVMKAAEDEYFEKQFQIQRDQLMRNLKHLNQC